MKSLKLKAICIIFVATVLLWSSCTKKEESPKSKMELITAAPWKFSEAGVDLNMDGTIDQPLRPDLLPACATDNVFTFKMDGAGVLDEGPAQCNTSLPKLTPFTWYFFNNETEINLSANILPVMGGNLKIVELSETKFSVSKLVGIHGFPTYLNIVSVFVH